MFINSTTYGANFANWGSKPFERMREIGKKPFISKFYGESTYCKDFAKEEGKQLPPEFEREYEKKFKEEFRKKNQRGEFAALLNSPFLAKSTSHE